MKWLWRTSSASLAALLRQFCVGFIGGATSMAAPFVIVIADYRVTSTKGFTPKSNGVGPLCCWWGWRR